MIITTVAELFHINKINYVNTPC